MFSVCRQLALDGSKNSEGTWIVTGTNSRNRKAKNLDGNPRGAATHLSSLQPLFQKILVVAIATRTECNGTAGEMA
jgi:hypothetical protein